MIFLLYKFFIRALLLPQICLQIFCSKHFAKLPKLIQTTQNCVKSSRRPFEQSLFSLPILTVLRDRKYCLIQAIHFSKLLCKKVTKKETPLRILFAIVFPFKIVNDMMSGKGLQTHGRQAALCASTTRVPQPIISRPSSFSPKSFIYPRKRRGCRIIKGKAAFLFPTRSGGGCSWSRPAALKSIHGKSYIYQIVP